jgi:sphinganine-1-phosphate aldolase
MAPSLDAVLEYIKSQPRWVIAEHVALGVLSLAALRRATRDLTIASLIGAIPGAQGLVSAEMDKEVDKAVREMFPAVEGAPAPILTIPPAGLGRAEMEGMLAKLKAIDAKGDGKMFAYVYKTASDHETVTEHAFQLFMHENALNPAAFPSLLRMENEVVSMSLAMTHAPDGAAGCMTSGGTESILCAVKAMREWAREKRPHITRPNMIASSTVHPAFEKAAHYFGVEIRHVPVGADLASDIDGYRRVVDGNTILLVVSAPQYPHGIIDHVEAASALALERDIPLHVDSCIGGFVLPFIEKLGHAVPRWDFRVAGVTSISADLHKYGYSPKGASVVMFRTTEMRSKMFFAYSQWPGGLFVSPSLLGTRGGGAIAGAWASLVSLGEEGFLRLTEQVMHAKAHIRAFVDATDGIAIMGNPDASILAVRSTDPKINILAVADVMENKFGWKIDRQQLPATLHMTLMPIHYANREMITEHLGKSIDIVRADPDKFNTEGTAAMYGMVAKVGGLGPSILDSFLTKFMAKVFAVRQ